jgi:hypothetical protein
MNSHLDPVIVQKLQAFARRRRTLIMIRGVLAIVATLVAAMILVAAVDYYIPLLPDWVRWVLSGMAYASVFVIAWRQCLGPLLHSPDERQIARILEHAEPKLREDLLSAVELGHSEGAIFDSLQFRNLLQTDVSARIQHLKVDSLLPVGLLKRYINVSAILGIAVVCLMVLSGFRFGSLFLRALMPGANLDRVSATQILIIEPNPGDQTVPQGDAVRLVVELNGQLADGAKLESEGITQGRQVTAMTPLGNGRFATVIQVSRENISYRVQAGDGLTRRYQLTAVGRPHEVEFEKSFRFPAYANIPAVTATDDNGDLSGLEGTGVDLMIKTNQRVKSGELRLDRGKAASAIPLVAMPDGRLSATVPLTESGIYRVHLVSAETGFENKFSPEYELQAIPDLIPTIRIDEPVEDLISPADGLVSLSATAGDDVGLARLVQMVQVNDGAWRDKVVDEVKGHEAIVKRDWDLSAEGVKAGDLITTKFAATDLKGSRTESRPIRIIIVAAAIEMKRFAGLASRKALDEAVKRFAAAGAVLEETAVASLLKFDETKPGDEGRQQALAAFASAFTDYEAKLSQAWQALDAPLRDAPANHESSDLVLLGRLLGLTYNDEARQAGKILTMLHANPSMPAVREVLGEVHRIVARANVLTKVAHQVYQFNFSAEQIDVVTELGILLSSEQRRIRELTLAAMTPDGWGKVASRLHAVLSVTKNLDTVLESLKTGSGPIAANAEGLLNSSFFAWSRGRMQDALKEEPPDDRLMAVFEDFTRYFGKVVGESVNLKVRLAKLAEEAIIAKDLASASGPETPLGLAASMHQYLVEELDPSWLCVSNLRNATSSPSKLDKLSLNDQSALIETRWGATKDILKAHADLEEVRAAADNAFVADLRRATVAIQSVQTLSHGDGPEMTANRLEVLDQSLRILESGHNLQELLDGIGALVALDRWEVRMPHGRTTMPRDWAWIATRLQMAPGHLKQLVLTDEAARKAVESATLLLEEIPTSQPFRAAMFEMGERRKFKHSPRVARIDLEQVAGRVRATLALLRNPMETARKNLAKLTPNISELALALAKEEAALKSDSNQLAAKAAAAQPEENATQARPQLTRQQQINTRVEMLKDLIRADANEQTILKKEQRDRMRDADDALAMLKDPPVLAEQALLVVTQGAQAAQQLLDLDRAVEQEQKLVDALKLIGGHYEALEEGKSVEESRLALRQAEEELGIKDELDQQFAKAEMLAAMAEKSAEELLKELEAKLPGNPDMQTELERISNDALALAKEELARAAKAEAAAAAQVGEQAVRDRDPKLQLSALEAARLAATCARQAQAAADTSRQLLEQTANQPAIDRSKTTHDKATTAVPLADQLVEAAQRLESAGKLEDVLTEANAVIQKAGQMIQSSDQCRNEVKPVAEIAKAEAQKAGPQQANFDQAAQQSVLTLEKSTQAIEAAQQAEAAARAAAERAQAMAKIPEGPPQTAKLAKASLEQQPVQPNAREAAANVDRAGRHEERLGNPETAQKLDALAAQIAETAQNDVTAAEKAIRESKQAAEALAPVQNASDELAKLVEALKEAAKDAMAPSPPAGSPPGSPPGGKPGAGPAGEPSPSTPAEQQEMARALDALDQQLNAAAAAASAQSPPGEGPPGEGPPGEGPPGMGPPGMGPPGMGPPGMGPPGMGPPGPMPGMAQSAMAGMRKGRATKPSPLPGMPPPSSEMEESEVGAKLDLAGPPTGPVPEAAVMKKGEWGMLPKKLAEQLTRGRTDDISDEYRDAVETYYRVIAEKSRTPR